MMSTPKKKIAAIQTNSSSDISANLAQIEHQLKMAAEQNVSLVLLPEMFATLDAKHYRAIADGDAVTQQLSQWAQQFKLWIIAGAVPQPCKSGDERSEQRVRSACLVLDDQGQQQARYDKIHLFDVDVGDAQGSYKESDSFAPGDEVVVVNTPVGRIGLAICYDLRFPQLFQQMRAQGAEIFTLPAAFTHTTGEAHWQALLRARAIEQQCYVLAANQCGWHDEKRRTWGHSQIIDPWGQVLTELDEEVGIAIAEVDLDKQQSVRAKMPVFGHQRLGSLS